MSCFCYCWWRKSMLRPVAIRNEKQRSMKCGLAEIIISVYWILFAALPDATTFLETIIHIYGRNGFMQNLLFLFWWVLRFWGWRGRGHATRTLSGSCHPRRGAALKEAESSRGSPPPHSRWFLYMSSGVRWGTEIFPLWSPQRWEHGGQRRQTLVKRLIFLEEKKK